MNFNYINHCLEFTFNVFVCYRFLRYGKNQKAETIASVLHVPRTVQVSKLLLSLHLFRFSQQYVFLKLVCVWLRAT